MPFIAFRASETASKLISKLPSFLSPSFVAMAAAAVPLMARLIDDACPLPEGLQPGRALLRVQVGGESEYSCFTVRQVDIVKRVGYVSIVMAVADEKYIRCR